MMLISDARCVFIKRTDKDVAYIIGIRHDQDDAS